MIFDFNNDTINAVSATVVSKSVVDNTTISNVIENTAFQTAVISTPFFWVGIMLIVADSTLAVIEAIKKKHKFSLKILLKGLLTKFIQYTCFTLVGSSLSVVFNSPKVVYIIMTVICAIELDSCKNHYFYCRGIKSDFSLYNIIKDKLLEKLKNL